MWRIIPFQYLFIIGQAIKFFKMSNNKLHLWNFPKTKNTTTTDYTIEMQLTLESLGCNFQNLDMGISH